MRTILFLIAIFWNVSWVFAQNAQLVYLKTDQARGSYFFPKSDSAYLRTFPNTTTDASLFPEDVYELSPSLDNSRFHVVYDGQLASVAHIEMKVEDYDDLRPLKKIDDRYFMYYPGYNFSGSSPFYSNPPRMGNFPDSAGINFLIEYDASQNILRMPFNCTCPDYQSTLTEAHIPYLDFRSQIGATGGVFESNNTMAWMNDGTVITTLNVYHQITINSEDQYPINEGYQWGDIWVKIDPATGQYIATSQLSQNGTALTNSVNVSADGAHIYRTGVLRGQDMQISPDGTIWNATSEDDSLFDVFMIKENMEGNNVWSVPLFSYENSFGTDTSNFSLSQLNVEPVIELNSDIYLGLYYRLDVRNVQDSLYFDDYMGDVGMYGKPEWFTPDPVLPGYVAKSAREVIRFNENGERIEKLVFPIRDPDPWGFYNAGWYFQEPKLFEVNGKLGWPFAYASTTDTTLYFLKQTVNQPIDSVGIELPAGRGTFIVWMDEELNIINHTIFSYTTSSAVAQGVSVWNIKTLNEDTLAVFGRIGNNTTTSLDPVGIAGQQTYSPATSYMALYSLPDFLVSAKHPTRSQKWDFFPNPANETITFKGNYTGDVEFFIYDVTGRQVKSGHIADGQQFYTINIDKFQAGIYIVNFQNGHRTIATGKFAVY